MFVGRLCWRSSGTGCSRSMQASTSSRVGRRHLDYHSTRRNMATVKDSVPHVIRTAEDPRQGDVHAAILSRIELVNQNIRLFRLSLTQGPVRHLPGQYVDLQIPDIETVGGFTITSPPQTASIPFIQETPNTRTDGQQNPNPGPYVELAIQKSPNNPPAAYLYKHPPEILNAPVTVRIGGSFTYPPYSLSRQEFEKISNVVFIAGGVGINPIMSMVSAIDLAGHGRLGGMPERVRILYSSRREIRKNDAGVSEPEEVLFERRLKKMAARWQGHQKVDLQYTLFETRGKDESNHRNSDGSNTRHVFRRMTQEDLFDAIGPKEMRESTLVYVCGLPTMTDQYVEFLKHTEGLDEKRVLCEKWW